MMLKWICVVAAMAMAACNWPNPAGPTDGDDLSVTLNVTSASTAGDTVRNCNDGCDDGEEVVGDEEQVAIHVNGTNDSGRTVYRIGPGTTYARTGGDAATVWCRPDSDCNGEGIGRSSVNAASPMGSWVEDRHALFRRSGSDGVTVMFEVDGRPLTHAF